MRFILFILLFTLFFGCGHQPSPSLETSVPAIENPLTLDLSFGDDESKLPSDYLLARPEDIAVDDNNNIFINDETKIKVYSFQGEPKAIIGRKGQGPGEFEWINGISVGPSQLIMVLDMYVVSLFSPEYKFISKNRISLPKTQMKGDSWYLADAVYLTENERLLYIEIEKNNYSPDYQENQMILNEKNGQIDTLINYPVKHIYIAGGSGWQMTFDMPFLSTFVWALASDNRIVYVETDKDVIKDEKNAFYDINIFSIETKAVKKLTRQYIRTPIDSKHAENWDEDVRRNSKIYQPVIKATVDKMKDVVAKEKYNHSLKRIKTDGNYVFAFLYLTNDKKEIYTDVFDIDKGQYISSLFFPKIPDVIKNGYAYYLISENKEYPRVEKYRINPKVYGR